MSITKQSERLRVKGPPSLALGSTTPAHRRRGAGAHTMPMNIKKRKTTAAAARSLPRPHSEYLRDDEPRARGSSRAVSQRGEVWRVSTESQLLTAK